MNDPHADLQAIKNWAAARLMDKIPTSKREHVDLDPDSTAEDHLHAFEACLTLEKYLNEKVHPGDSPEDGPEERIFHIFG